MDRLQALAHTYSSAKGISNSFVPIVFLILLSLVACISATPIAPVAPESDRVGWVSNPGGRGTSKILVTCCVTLFLCIFTAIHPDVIDEKDHADHSAPGGGDSCTVEDASSTNQGKGKDKSPLRNRRRLCFEALLLPEVLFTHARRQWCEASRLHQTLIAGHYLLHHMNNTDDDTACWHESCPRKGSNDASSWRLRLKGQLGSWGLSKIKRFLDVCLFPSEWDLFGAEVAFFVVQGGFVRADVNGKHTPISSSDFYYAFVNDPEGVSEMICVEDIRDKGKANFIGKLVVCAQCGWFLLNVLARVSANLPITFLELHVTSHIAVTAMLYMFWWNKQLNANQPIVLKIPRFNYTKGWATVPLNAVRPIGKWNWLLSTIWAVPPNHDHVYDRTYTCTAESKKDCELETATKEILNVRKWLKAGCTPHTSGDAPCTHNTPHENPLFQRILSDWRVYIEENTGVSEVCKPDETTERGGQTETERTTEKDGELGTVTMAPVSAPPDGEVETLPSSPPAHDGNGTIGSKTSGGHVDNRFPYGRDKNDHVGKIPGLVSAVFFLAYSALHAALWDADFPTSQEKWLWRVSCLLIMAKPFLLYLIAGIVIYLRKRRIGRNQQEEIYKSTMFLNGFFLFLCLGGTWTLLFESFFSLRDLPRGAYETVPWSVYLPPRLKAIIPKEGYGFAMWFPYRR